MEGIEGMYLLCQAGVKEHVENVAESIKINETPENLLKIHEDPRMRMGFHHGFNPNQVFPNGHSNVGSATSSAAVAVHVPATSLDPTHGAFGAC